MNRVLTTAIGLFALFSIAGCFPTVDASCEELANQQCEACFGCASDDFSGGTLCDLADGATEESCRSDLQDVCSQQASTLTQPSEQQEECADSLDQDTCSDLLGRIALNQSFTTYQCEYLL